VRQAWEAARREPAGCHGAAVGHAAIRQWREKIPALTTIHCDITSVRDDHGVGTVTVLVTGDFDGSPITLHYDYALARSTKIAFLVIHP
jgi:hypothetical protein